jgi:hypothetical protein
MQSLVFEEKERILIALPLPPSRATSTPHHEIGDCRLLIADLNQYSATNN